MQEKSHFFCFFLAYVRKKHYLCSRLDLHAMKRILLLLTALPVATLLAMASPVSETAAMQTAQAFLSSRGKLVTSMTAAAGRRTNPETFEPYYVFNLSGDGGFVVVSGDDSVEPILGYADEGNIDLENLPDGLRYLLNSYAEEIKSQVADTAARTSVIRTSVAPLVQTRWNQNAPFNNNCPIIDQDSTRAATGCVATAMAQLMKYWNWPQSACQGIPGYAINNGVVGEMDSLPPTTFDWNNMLSIYDENSPEAANAAVATLMEYCGNSICMRYNRSSSSYAGAIGEALKMYYDYDEGVQFVRRKHYSYSEWVNLIYNELAAGRPLVYSSRTVSSGHSFICDGYDVDDYFHFNWGWSGKSDGYFRLANLNPREQGTGGSSTRDGYNITESALIGVQPSTQVSGKHYCLNMNGASSILNNNTQSLRFELTSFVPGTHTFDARLVLYNTDGSFYKNTFVWDSLTIQMAYGKYLYCNFTNYISPYRTPEQGGIADGTYLAKMYSRIRGSQEWLECSDWESQLVTLTITNGEVTMYTPHPDNNSPADVSFSVPGTPTAGVTQRVVAHVTGSEYDYCNDLVLFVNGQAMRGTMTDIPAGQTVDVVFTYTPQAEGLDTLQLYTDDDGNAPLGQEYVIAVAAAEAVTDTLTLNTVITLHNMADNKFYGGHIRATVRLENPSTRAVFAGNYTLRMYEKTPDRTSYLSFYTDNRTIIVPKDSFITFEYDVPDLVVGNKYLLRAYYKKGTMVDGQTTYEWLYTDAGYAYMVAGYELFAADGTSTLHPVAETLDCGNAACVDLRLMGNMETVTNFVPSSNPNSLYLLADTANIQQLAIVNTVQNGVADNIALTDGHAFYSPIRFTATNISYTRPSSAGLSTIYLPFDATFAGCQLYTFSDESSDKVFFEEVSELKGNTPYLITSQTNNSPLSFQGSNAEIEPSEVHSLSGNLYIFSGCTYLKELENVYMLNGNMFVLQENSPSYPFRAWFRPTLLSKEPMLPELLIGNPIFTAVSTLSEEPEKTMKFFLNGRFLIRKNGMLYDAFGNKVLLTN